jgi:hypothetical protein
MGTTLTGLTPATTYDALLKTTDNQPLTSTRKVITDGLGNDSALSLATTSASITGTLAVSSTLSASNFSGTSSNTNTGDETNATIKSKLGIATTSVDGYLTSTDWTTFNNKVATTRSISTTAPLSGGGDLSANRTLSIAQATTSTDGYLSSTNWNTFNGKESVLIFSAPLSRATNTISIPAATTSVSGHLTSTDWTTFNNKIGGSGTTDSIALFNGTKSLTASYIQQLGDFVQIPSQTKYFAVGDLGDGDWTFRTGGNTTTFIYYGLAVVSGGLSVFSGGINNSNGGITNAGALSGATSIAMGGALSGATNISGSGKLSIADIGASGTLNIGSTTTATKRLEITGDNNSGENNTLRFVDTDTTTSANQVIGKIEFFSNDATAPGGSVKAYISANALDTSPDAYLDFATDTTTGTPTVRQRIQADGKVLIGSTTDNGSTNLVQVSGGLDYNIVMRSVISAAWTLALTDKGKFIETTSGSATAVTIPTNASVAFPIGTQIWFVQTGSGVPTFSGDTGVTLRTRSSVRQPFARYSEVKLTKIATDEWYLTGDLKA